MCVAKHVFQPLLRIRIKPLTACVLTEIVILSFITLGFDFTVAEFWFDDFQYVIFCDRRSSQIISLVFVA